MNKAILMKYFQLSVICSLNFYINFRSSQIKLVAGIVRKSSKTESGKFL